MASFNQLNLIGYLGNAPVVKEGDNTVWVRLAVATNETIVQLDKKETQTFWHTVYVYGSRAKAIAEKRLHLSKGDLVHIQGPLKRKHWTDKDGNEREAVFVVANELQLLHSKAQPTPDNPPVSAEAA